IKGLEKSIPSTVKTLSVGGQTLTIAQVLKLAEERNANFKSARNPRQELKQLAQQRAQDEKDAVSFLADLRAALIAGFGRKNQILTTFGFRAEEERKPLTRSEERRVGT